MKIDLGASIVIGPEISIGIGIRASMVIGPRASMAVKLGIDMPKAGESRILLALLENALLLF